MAETVEAWCAQLVETDDLARKLTPAPPPPLGAECSWEPAPRPRRIPAPGRPARLEVVARSPRTPRAGALRRPEVRAQLLHTLLHHELQAAELFCWGVLAFPETPREFRAGLVRLAREELGHLGLYRARLEELGWSVGDFPVRDWFWERVPQCPGPAQFVALQGLGLEGANLEHSRRFAEQLRGAGDEASARVLDRVERDEVAHVAFALRWFEHFDGRPLDYDRWSAALPAPLTPALLRGPELNRAARLRAGLSEDFLERLEHEQSTRMARPGR